MATMSDVGLIEIKCRALKRIEGSDEAVKRGLTARDETSAPAALYSIWMRCVSYHTP